MRVCDSGKILSKKDGKVCIYIIKVSQKYLFCPRFRAFYRDEYCVILDALAVKPVRDDALHLQFGMHERQVRKILTDLKREWLVCDDMVQQRRHKLKVRGDLDIDALRKQIERGELGAL